MKLTHTKFEGVYILEPTVWRDERGCFFESYNYRTLGLNLSFVQDNEASSAKGVLRGLHYQLPPYAQTKLVRVSQGEVLDVIVDIRPDSPTYGQHMSVILSSTNFKQMLVPKGFAHGYIVLSDKAVFAYKCDAYYHKESDAGIRFDDTTLGINWILPTNEFIISEKDKQLPTFSHHKKFISE
ncbi:MAG: dTDP-4-dehydrorhamnose 3,5-epimerase [Saprospiraceae bacterium]|nr:dTDP-4-dehydrorhamnose 3,5-epimerase [Saprospiraceae bacterium]